MLTSISRPGISSSSGATRYARTSASSRWLHAQQSGFVGAILDSIGDGRDRLVLAWPSPPDNGFVATAIALREARATGKLAHATLALWPWRTGASYGARSLLVHPKDIALRAADAMTELRKQAPWADPRLGHHQLCMVELRLNDLVAKADADSGQNRRHRGRKSSSSSQNSLDISTIRNPTLLETTAVFAPSEEPLEAAYACEAEQVLKRVRRHTDIIKSGTINDYAGTVGNPDVTPFALMGLIPGPHRQLVSHLGHSRFATHGLDAVVVDLTRSARTELIPDWERQLTDLLASLDAVRLPRRPPVVVLCEDAFTMRRAEVALRAYNGQPKVRRPIPTKHGAVLLRAGILADPCMADVPRELPPILFEADIKDASLGPLRDRLISLARRLREAGRGSEAIAVRAGLRFLSTCASLPIGWAEAKKNVDILFEGDGADEIESRSAFYPTSVLQPMAEAGRTAPEFAADINELLADIRTRIDAWKGATPVSLKLAQLLSNSPWNARDVLLTLPDPRTVDVFCVSDQGVSCNCTVIAASDLGEQTTRTWRRILVVRPEPRVVRALLTMPNSPERILLLGDTAGATLITAELQSLASIRDFALFHSRAAALSEALKKGGAEDAMDLAELEQCYRLHEAEAQIDLTQAADGYAGEVIRLHLEGGEIVAYRPGSDVLVFTPHEVRPFRKSAARDVQPSDSILVLHRDIRDKLSEALSRSNQTAGQLKSYHEHVAKVRDRLPGKNLPAKARYVLAAMRAIDSSMGDHELPNIQRWLAVEPSDNPQPPCAARDQRRFNIFMEAVGTAKSLAEIFWNIAIVPSRAYSVREGYFFNRRIVQFVIDREGVTAGAGWQAHDGLWQAVVESVDRVIHTETSHGYTQVSYEHGLQ